MCRPLLQTRQKLPVSYFLRQILGCKINSGSVDIECAGNCNREVVECENGCPDDISCDVSFLVLNTDWIGYLNQALLFTWSVGTDQRTETVKEFKDFYGGGTSADTTCSVLYKGQMYIIGGEPDPSQISIIDGCSLTLVF